MHELGDPTKKCLEIIVPSDYLKYTRDAGLTSSHRDTQSSFTNVLDIVNEGGCTVNTFGTSCHHSIGKVLAPAATAPQHGVPGCHD